MICSANIGVSLVVVNIDVSLYVNHIGKRQ